MLVVVNWSSARKDVWAAGNLYEPYVGRWSRLVAKDLLTWLRVPARKDWLDVGCGTGALTEVILQHAEPRAVEGVDPSAEFVEHAKANISSPHVSFKVGDAQSLPAGTTGFDVAVAGLVLNFVPEPLRAVGKMELMRYFWDAAVALDRAAFDLDEGRRFPICQPTPLVELFGQAGLHEVEVRPIDVPTRFRDFDDYWSPFLGGQAPAPGYAMSLSEERRGALRDRIRASLPIAPDGSISLIARAWAVRGRTSL